jgi:hypothetical protein
MRVAQRIDAQVTQAGRRLRGVFAAAGTLGALGFLAIESHYRRR